MQVAALDRMNLRIGIDVDAVFGAVLDLLLALGELAVRGDDDLVAGDGCHFAGFLGGEHGAGIAGDALLEAGGDERRLGDEQRHRLALHVGAHQRAVGVVVFEERDEAGGDGNELLGRDVHVIDAGRLDIDEVALAAAHDAVGDEMALVVHGEFAWAMM